MTDFRTEHDWLGECAVPRAAYYGIHTMRALANFPVTGTSISSWSNLIVALAMVKQAAATANCELGLLDRERAQAICAACEQIRGGKLHQHFVVDMIQGGAGAASNMNANEVIANLALELLGQPRGAYYLLHPDDHVNLSQSTNDVYSTALRLACYSGVLRLIDAVDVLERSCQRKAAQFADVLKMGRTQLQDTVLMTLGQEFGAFAVMLGKERQRLHEAARLMCEISFGGTAIGTGVNTDSRYGALACRALEEISGMPLVTSPDLIEATHDIGAFVQLSSVLKRIALKLSKMCNDLRLLSSGPRAGFGEIRLPPVQAGTGSVPGRANPVIPEVVNQIAFEVIGNDVTISFAAEGGQLQLNAFKPIIAFSLFKSIAHLGAGCTVLAERCIDGIEPNHKRLLEIVDSAIGIAIVLPSACQEAAAAAR